MKNDLIDFVKTLNIKDCLQELKELPQVDCPVTHHFSKGVYTRETHMKKGTFAIGKKHRYKTINIIMKGKLAIYNGKDSPILHVKAPYIFISESGVQKMAYFEEDTIWLNCHSTESTNLKDIEKQFIIDDNIIGDK